MAETGTGVRALLCFLSDVPSMIGSTACVLELGEPGGEVLELLLTTSSLSSSDSITISVGDRGIPGLENPLRIPRSLSRTRSTLWWNLSCWEFLEVDIELVSKIAVCLLSVKVLVKHEKRSQMDPVSGSKVMRCEANLQAHWTGKLMIVLCGKWIWRSLKP